MKRIISKFRTLGLMTLSILLVASISQAQKTTSDIVGTVVDPSDQVIAGATVTAKFIGTGATKTTTTDSTGSFRIPSLQTRSVRNNRRSSKLQ